MIITAYKCPDTGEVFEHQSEYNRHRRRYLREQRIAQKDLADRIAYDKLVKDFNDGATSVDDISAWIIANNDLITSQRWNFFGKQTDFKITSLKWTKLMYRERCSNTHRSPRSGVTNWSCKDDKPRGYPGVHARLEITYSGSSYRLDLHGFLDSIAVNTGCGGGGSGSYEVDVTLFEDDWPAMKTLRVLSD